MSSESEARYTQLNRIRRVSDMMITAHACRKERLQLLSLISDLGLFTCSVLLCSVAFADQTTFRGILGPNFPLLIGLFSILVFVFSFASYALDWKVLAERHSSALKAYADLKFECTKILDAIERTSEADIERFLSKYQTLTASLISIPESAFNTYKRKHRAKIFISTYLDAHPGASIWLLKIKLWLRDNCRPTT